MKKFLVAFVVSLLSVVSYAEDLSFTQVLKVSDFGDIVPVSFVNPNRGYMVVSEYGYDNGDDYYIYNVYNQNMEFWGSFTGGPGWDKWIEDDIECYVSTNGMLSPQYEGYNVAFSQTLFNEDEDIEYFLYEENDQEESIIKLMQVKSGECLAQIKGDLVYGVYILNDVYYLVTDVDDWDCEDWYVAFYRITKGTNSSVDLELTQKIKVSGFPNPIRRGEIFTLNSNILDGTQYNVTITSQKGIVMKTIKANTQTVEIDTSDLARGLYIYAINQEGKKAISGKFIVK